MKKAYTILCFIFFTASNVFSQQAIRDARQRSWQSFVYRITADSAQHYISKTLMNPDQFLNQQPFAVWKADSALYEELPQGNYLIIHVNNIELQAEYYCQSNIRLMPVNNQHRVQLEVKDWKGNLLNSARLWVNNKEIKYDEVTKSFTIPAKKPDEAVVKVAIPGDTLFMELSAKEDVEKGSWSQWWRNFSYTNGGRIITWPVRAVKTMIKQPARYWIRKKRKETRLNNGYMVFNKPKYLPGDTIKFKAYVLNKKYKQIRYELDVYLDYYNKGKYEHKKITRLKPVTSSSFIHEFVLGDSLDTDKNYTIIFQGKNGISYLRGNFKLEDYLLDEVASYSLRSQQEEYFPRDSMVFYANAKDANGLSLMDGKVKLYLIAEYVSQFYPATEFIPDTLWQGEKELRVNADTKFTVPTDNFPDADITVKALVEFRNSNNEIQEKQTNVQFIAKNNTIHVKQDGAFIQADFKVNGKSVTQTGWMEEGDEEERKIIFPHRQKINPYAAEYWFSVKNNSGKTVHFESFDIPQDYNVSLSRIQQQDTTGFALYNPYKIPVHYSVFNGPKLLAAAADTAEWINWKKIFPKNKSYRVEWNYIWAGEERKDYETIALLDKVLQTKIDGPATIYPGQTDTITVTVNDYKGRPADDVNLSAVSYNSQFKEDIRVNEPPYLQRFKGKRRILFDNYEMEEAGYIEKFILGKHQGWRKNFMLDTMLYYQFLFPKETMVKKAGHIKEFLPQVAVHIVKGGVPQEIYMLYINREFAYYNGVTDKSNYAFTVYPGYMQAGIRIRNKYIEIDSIYMQPYYKHDIVFDLDKLPAGAKVVDRPEQFISEERQIIEKQIWQLQNDPQTNNGYVWQGNRLFYIGSSNRHLIGPFNHIDSLQFFKPGSFDFRFLFESGYEYRLSPQMARLERKDIFHQTLLQKVNLPYVERTTWRLGDTVAALPVIEYKKVEARSFYLNHNYKEYYRKYGNEYGSLRIKVPADSIFSYAVLINCDSGKAVIKTYGFQDFYNLSPGRYKLVLITNKYKYLSTGVFEIKGGGLNCVQYFNPVYTLSSSDIGEYLKQRDNAEKNEQLTRREKEKMDMIRIEQESFFGKDPVAYGNGTVSGYVRDAKGGEPIAGASIYIKGTRSGTATASDGSYKLQNIKGGRYTLIFASVGYMMKEISIAVTDGSGRNLDVVLEVSEASMSEVVVTAYGVTRSKKSLSYSVSSVKGLELTQGLSGKVAGLAIYDGIPGASDSAIIRIRGNRSIMGDKQPLYIINGVPVDALPEGFDMTRARVDVLKGNDATVLYGSRAANGVILITTSDFLPKSLRDKFSDYAFWQPNLFTDKDGKVKFTVTYPDNITGWQTYLLGMDKKRRFTKAGFFTKSFKPLLAQLSTPQFLIEGDSSVFIGKSINYTSSSTDIKTEFKVNNSISQSGSKELAANASVVDGLNVTAINRDTITVQFTVTNAKGYSDGERRKIPVFKKGIEEVKGSFQVLEKDTSFTFIPDQNAGEVTLYAQNNTLDILLDEIKYLKEYPYFCMEQVASKLTGLLMERKIKEALKLPFENEKEVQSLLSKLQKGQLFKGGWSWWQGGDFNLSITSYVTQAMLPLRNDAAVESSIRNALLYLQNRLPLLRRNELLTALFTLSEAGHYMNYTVYIAKLPFDSLTLHQQWQIIKIKQQQKMDYEKELNSMMKKKTETMFGGLLWGEDSYYWESNSMATTALAFSVLEKEEKHKPLLKQIIQFFLERREGGRWRNTVESAKTLAAILPTILSVQPDFNSETQLVINADKNLMVNKFPFSYTANVSSPVQVSKTGGGLVYFTAWQKIFNKQPVPVADKFSISTWFERSGKTEAVLTAGEKTIMKVKVEVLKDAEYVQIEIPIPAGCTYAGKKQDEWRMYKEYFKNKLILFGEKMNKGVYNFEIELEPRYAGLYHLNPAKAELMYFPVFYGRNEMKTVEIKKQ